MKQVYFVRHGESESNVTKVVQGLHDVLTPEGERQALRVAERATGVSFQALLSSDTVRARMTAEAIAHATGKEIELLSLLREVKRPTSIIGHSWKTEEYQSFLTASKAHKNEPDWHQEDEENFFDVQKRAGEALAFLSARPEESLMVVTHGLFLKHMIARMVLGDVLTPELFDRWNLGFRTSNTGLTICLEEEGGAWCMISWNDHAHFAD